MLRWRTGVLALAAAAALGATAADGASGAEVLVSLGDSYSSGEAAGQYDRGSFPWVIPSPTGPPAVVRTDSTLSCHRSPRAWPRYLGVAREHHLACSGARFEHLDEGQYDERPDDEGQVTRLARIASTVHVDRVLMTMGGNDVKFGKRVRDCFLSVGFGCLRNLGDIQRDLDKRRSDWVAAYRRVMAAASGPHPGASAPQLVVVGYPSILPPASVDGVRCGWLRKGAQRRAAELVAMLDGALRAAAQEAGAHFVSVADVLRGHELCTEDSWLREISGDPGNPEQAHPTPRGQRAIARRVRAWLRANPLRPLAPSPAPAPPADLQRTYAMKTTVNVRASASNSSARVGKVWPGEQVWVRCQESGPRVKGSTLWDYIEYQLDDGGGTRRGYVADAYVLTGQTTRLAGVPFGGCLIRTYDPVAVPPPPAPPPSGESPPAPAPSNPYTAAQACGSAFTQSVATHDLQGQGVVHLLRDPRTDEVCSATMKTTLIGQPTSTEAWVIVDGDEHWTYDKGDFRYYAGPVTRRAGGRCVAYAGGHNGQNWTSGWICPQ